MSVLLFGHSFIRRLGMFLSAGQYDQNLNLPPVYSVRCHGIGGATVRPGPKSLQAHLHNVHASQVIFLQIGGNDITSPLCDPALLARDIISFANLLITGHGVSHVIIGELFYRYAPNLFAGYNEIVTQVNKCLKSQLKGNNHVTVWAHRGLYNNPQTFMHPDGVHLGYSGWLKYAKTIQVAVKKHYPL